MQLKELMELTTIDRLRVGKLGHLLLFFLANSTNTLMMKLAVLKPCLTPLNQVMTKAYR